MGIRITDTNRIPQTIKQMQKINGRKIKVGVMDTGDIGKYAAVQEFGATIKPKNGKYLALPTPHAKGKRPKDFPDLHFVPVRNGQMGLLVRETQGRGKGRYGARSDVYFILLRSVTIPERSFIRSGFDENEKDFFDYAKMRMNEALENDIDPNVMLDALGLELKGIIQTYTRDLRDPPDSPFTIANKGSSNPLVNTGQLLEHITYVIDI